MLEKRSSNLAVKFAEQVSLLQLCSCKCAYVQGTEIESAGYQHSIVRRCTADVWLWWRTGRSAGRGAQTQGQQRDHGR